MKLYGMGHARSLRALWALEETGIEFEYQNVRLFDDGEHAESAQTQAYRALNFEGKVPTLVDGDLVLTESAAIVNHIARKSPKSGLIPTDTDLLARYDQVMFFVMAELEQPLWNNGKHRFALPEEHRIAAMLDTASYEFAKAVTTLDALLGDNDYAVGDQFTMADILIAQTLNWAARFKFVLPDKFAALNDKHFQRPAALRALARIE